MATWYSYLNPFSSKEEFNENECYIPTVWCGDENVYKKFDTVKKVKYTRTGTRRECLKKGFGAGVISTRKKTLPTNSLQEIKYIGEKHEASFKRYRITNTQTLLSAFKKNKKAEISKTLKDILKKKDGNLDIRAYNSVLLYLYNHGFGDLPKCEKISVL